MKVVLDTNCLLQIVFPRARYKDEYREILERRFNDVQFADNVIEAILSMPNIEYVNPSYRFNLITADPDDNKFVDCAVIAGATYIVSNDHHFQELEHYDFPKVNICILSEFLDIVRTL